MSGSSSTSSMKIYLNYNITQNRITELEISSGTKSDSKFTKNIIPILKKDDLVLRDLGFFKIECFKEIEEKKAYFISRYFLATNLYIDNKKVDLLEFLNSKKNFSIIDENVVISAQKFATRLIAMKVPDEVYNQRVRDIRRKHNRVRGEDPQKKTLALQRYVIFITNIPRQTVSAGYIGTIYRLRWEIELCFKRWKSIFRIDRLTGTNGNRTLCFIYAKLIAILLSNTFEHYALSLAHQKSRELSSDKFFKWLLDRDRFQRLLAGEFTVKKFLGMISENIEKLLKDKRKKRLSSLNLILSSSVFYGDNDRIR